MEEPHVIYGVHVTNRTTQVPNVQKLLTEYGCDIKTRIGLHHVDENGLFASWPDPAGDVRGSGDLPRAEDETREPGRRGCSGNGL